MNRTGIPYLDYTWNPSKGCSPTSEGCAHCWASKMSKRLAGMGVPGYSKDDPFKVTYFPDRLNEPLKVKKPSVIGVSFMGDLFHEDVSDFFLEHVYNMIFEANQHTFLILTKRVERMFDWHSRDLFLSRKPIPNFIIGTSVENQRTADDRIPVLQQIPAAARWISFEPLLEYIDTAGLLDNINWAVIGCESGLGARPMKLFWAWSIQEHCFGRNIPSYMKQITGKGGKTITDINQFPKDLQIREYPEMLEGKQWTHK